MTISNRSGSTSFYGTDPVAGSVRASLTSTVIARAVAESDSDSRPCHAAPLDLETLYPSLFPPAPPARRWSLRRLVFQP